MKRNQSGSGDFPMKMKIPQDHNRTTGPGQTTAAAVDRLTEEKIKWSNYVAEADVYMRNYDYSKAGDMFSLALSIEPNNLHALTCRSHVRNLNGDPKLAEDDADMILSIDPKSQSGHMCKANAL